MANEIPLKTQNFTYKVYSYFEFVSQKHLVQAANNLTLHGNSGMRRQLAFLTAYDPKDVKCNIIFCFKNDQPVGWAMLCNSKIMYNDFCRNNIESNRFFMTYVDPKYRGKSLAKNIFKHARKHAGNSSIAVFPWNDKSYGFFDSLKNNYKLEYCYI